MPHDPQREAAALAVVTGGGTGIGRAIVLELVGRGHTVIVVGRRSESLVETARLAALRGGLVLPVVADVRDDACLASLDAAVREGAAESATDRGTAPLILVNNAAAYGTFGAIERVPVDDLREVVETGLFAAVRLCRYVLPGMKAAGFGRIVNIGSVAGALGAPGQAVYAAVKSSLVGLTRSLALEAAPHGVTCNLLELGLVDTERTRAALAPGMWDKLVASTAVRRPGKTEEIAAAVGFLVSEQAGFVNGATLPVSGGLGLGLVPDPPPIE